MSSPDRYKRKGNKPDRHDKINDDFAKRLQRELKTKARLVKQKERTDKRAKKTKDKKEKAALQRSLDKNHPLHPHKKPSKIIGWIERNIQLRGKG